MLQPLADALGSVRYLTRVTGVARTPSVVVSPISVAAPLLASSASTVSETASSSSAGGTTRDTAPSRCASKGSMSRPVSISSSAAFLGITRARMAEIIIGHSPTLTSGSPSLAPSTQMVTSQATEMWIFASPEFTAACKDAEYFMGFARSPLGPRRFSTAPVGSGRSGRGAGARLRQAPPRGRACGSLA